VFGIVDSLVAIPASWMGRDGNRAVQDADRLQGSGNDKGATDMAVWDGVVVEVKADVRRLADLHRNHFVRGKWLIW
jgi:hypothetical protein